MGLTCVCADVAPQQPRPGEGLPAGGADAGEGVGADVHLQSPQAGVLLGTVFAEEGRPSRRDGGLPLLRLLRGADVSRDAGALHPLARGVRVHGLGAGGVRGAPLVLLAAAAGAAAEAAGGAEVQGPRGPRGLGLGG